MPTPVEDIKQRLDLVDFISESVPLKAAGSNWKGKCPFHNEKTPSFMVSRERGSWHCFGCGKGGDIFTFVQEQEGLDFPEALRLLAKRAGVQLREYNKEEQTQRTKVLDVLRWVSRYYQEVLRKTSDAEPARKYLAQRQVNETSLEDFGVGYAPSGWDITYQALKKKGFADDDIFQAGLTIRKDRGAGFYDRFRNRIMFPISDVHGTVVGFSGRVLEVLIDPQGPVPAKYINSPQTIVYDKGRVLYALDKAKQDIKRAGRAVLVEGQMDCLMSHQAGVNNAVASSGTALTADQVQLLKRFTQNLVLAFDQDAAGAQAALRGVDQALLAKMDVRIVRLSQGKDPDELIRHDLPAWQKAIVAAQPVMEYYVQEATSGRDLNKVDDKKAAVKFLLPIIAQLGDQVEQAHYLQHLADLVRVDVAVLRQSMSAKPKAAPVATSSAVKESAESPDRRTDRFRAVSERLIALLLREPKLLDQLSGQFDPDMLVGPDLQTLYKTLVIWYSEKHFSTRQALADQASSLDPEQQELFTLLTLRGDHEYPTGITPSVEHDILTMVAALKRRALSLELRRLEADIRRLEQSGGAQNRPVLDGADASQLTDLLARVQAVTDQLRSLA
ncbi:MAG: DNA primase [Patescibacteria group bacterium]